MHRSGTRLFVRRHRRNRPIPSVEMLWFVVLRSGGNVVARIESGALEAAPDPTVRPNWQVHFAVSDIRSCARVTEAYGGSVLRENRTEAVLRDPDGARFTVTSRDAP